MSCFRGETMNFFLENNSPLLPECFLTSAAVPSVIALSSSNKSAINSFMIRQSLRTCHVFLMIPPPISKSLLTYNPKQLTQQQPPHICRSNQTVNHHDPITNFWFYFFSYLTRYPPNRRCKIIIFFFNMSAVGLST